MPKEKEKERGKLRVVVGMTDAARDIARQKRRRDDPPPHVPRNGIAPNRKNQPPNWTPDKLGLPPDCPVQCLGFDGELKHLIDSMGQFRSWSKGDFTQQGISDLFSATPNYPKWCAPRYGKAYKVKDGDGERTVYPIESFQADAIREMLFQACARAGPFSPTDKLRGRGAWRTRAGELIYHAGEELWTWDVAKQRPVVQETGLHEGLLYPRLPGLPAPWTEPVADDENPAATLLEGFRKWNWRRPNVDPVLMLGWIGVAYLGGVLDWRSAVLLLGDKETGKSTLQRVLNLLFGDALFHSSDTTAAGIYQRMAQDTRPVALDELEPGADPRKVANVVQLMRDASSGAMGRRGGADGTASEFQMRSAFLFSAINNPIYSSQDLSRVAIVRLMPLDRDKINEKPLPIDEETCGRMVLGVLMREYHRFPAALDFYKRALHQGGHANRGQDTYGTLLACADLLLGAELGERLEVPLSQTIEGQENAGAAAYWAEHLAAESLPELEDAKPNWRDCGDHIISSEVEVWRSGTRSSVGSALADLDKKRDDYGREHCARDLDNTGLGLLRADELVSRCADHYGTDHHEAEARLGFTKFDGWVLAVPNRGQALQKLLRDTPWQSGGWADALRQCPHRGVMVTDLAINRLVIRGTRERCTLIVLKRYHEAPER